VYLCKTFETLLQSRHPQMFFHAVTVGVQPLSIVFPWMFSAFAGILCVDQVLILWDRILAYDSLELIAVLAAAICLFRAKAVLAAKTPDDIQDVFRELQNNMLVVPLLQQFLFS
jgi:hypothetical protein